MKKYDATSLVDAYRSIKNDPLVQERNRQHLRDVEEERKKAEFLSSNSYKLLLPGWYEANNLRVLTNLEAVLKDPDEEKVFAILGSVGSGKTVLAEQIANAVIPIQYRKSDYSFRDSNGLWEEVKASYNSNNWIRPTDILTTNFILDDLGSEDDTPASRSYFQNLLIAIYNRWRNNGFRLLVITTNLGIDPIQARYTERIRSRFDEMFNYLMLENRDFRKDKRRGWNENKK